MPTSTDPILLICCKCIVMFILMFIGAAIVSNLPRNR
jgi:hypothetical protein